MIIKFLTVFIFIFSSFAPGARTAAAQIKTGEPAASYRAVVATAFGTTASRQLETGGH